MKKKYLLIISLIIFLILCIPIPMRLKDGGSVEYRAIIYQVVDVHRLNELCSTGYSEGIIIKILGMQVFNNTSCDIFVNVHHVENVTMTIKEDSLPHTSMVVIIEDLNEEKYTFGEEFYIEKKETDRWKKLEIINDDYGFNEMGYLVGEDNKLEMNQDWSNIYGKLIPGKYRLVKSVYKDSQIMYFSVEFSL